MNAAGPHRQRRTSAHTLRHLCLFFLLGIVSGTLLSQQHIEIESIKGQKVTITPGGLVTLPIKITNRGTDRDYIVLFLRLPPGWRQLTQPPLAVLDTGASTIRLVTISPPKQVPAGIYEIQLSAVDSTHKWGQRLIPISIEVERLVSYEVVQVEAPRFSVGGDRMAYRYEIVNTGNDLLTFTVEARSSQQFAVDVKPRILHVPVGTGAYVDIIAASPASFGRREKHGLIVTVTPTAGGTSRSLTTLSDVLPRVSSTDPDRREFPVVGTMRFAGDNDHRGVQAEVRGYGSLREDQTDRLEFLFRSPETQSISALGIRDEYQAQYTWSGNKIYGGDRNYMLTTLTEIGRYAFGIGGETDVNDVAVGGFLNTTRFGLPARKQVAGYARYDVTPDIHSSFNILHRAEKASSTIASVTALTSPFGNATLDIEAAISAGPGNGDGAVSARLQGPLSFGTYDVRIIDAGKEFSSSYRDVQVASASLSAYVSRDIRLDLLARDERRNRSLDTLTGFSPRSQFVQFGGGLSNTLYLYYRASNYANPLSPNGEDRREDLLQIRASQRFSFVYASVFADIGTLTDRALASSGPTRRYVMNLNAQPFPRQSYTASVEYAEGPDFSSGQSTERVSTSFSANYQVAENTNARLLYYATTTESIGEQRYTIVDASLGHVFASQHRLTGRLRSTSLSGENTEYAALLEYGVPLAVPLGAVTSSGVLSGRIVDVSGEGISGVYLTAGGKAAVSNETGLFAFRNMPPGAYALDVDRGSLGLERIVHVPLPFEVQVIGGEESSIVLRTVSPGILQGVTKLFDNVPTGIRDSVVREEMPLDGSVLIAVDLTNGEEKHRRVTNSKGVFVFTDLRPGLWNVTLTPLRLPDQHAIDRAARTVEIRPGKSTLMSVQITPRSRRIRIIQEGGVLRPKQ